MYNIPEDPVHEAAEVRRGRGPRRRKPKGLERVDLALEDARRDVRARAYAMVEARPELTGVKESVQTRIFQRPVAATPRPRRRGYSAKDLLRPSQGRLQ